MVIIRAGIKNFMFNLQTAILQRVFNTQITFLNQGMDYTMKFVLPTIYVLKSHNHIQTVFNL
jgi:hypothetical protein